MKYRVYTYDLWGNDDDGFEVNDVFRTSLIIAFGRDFSDALIVKKIRKLFSKKLFARFFETEGDENTIYANYKGCPLCELRLER